MDCVFVLICILWFTSRPLYLILCLSTRSLVSSKSAPSAMSVLFRCSSLSCQFVCIYSVFEEGEKSDFSDLWPGKVPWNAPLSCERWVMKLRGKKRTLTSPTVFNLTSLDNVDLVGDTDHEWQNIIYKIINKYFSIFMYYLCISISVVCIFLEVRTGIIRMWVVWSPTFLECSISSLLPFCLCWIICFGFGSRQLSHPYVSEFCNYFVHRLIL